MGLTLTRMICVPQQVLLPRQSLKLFFSPSIPSLPIFTRVAFSSQLMATTATKSRTFATSSPTTLFSASTSCFVGKAWYTTCLGLDDTCIPRTTPASKGEPPAFLVFPTESSASCLPYGWQTDVWYPPGRCPVSYEVVQSSTNFVTFPETATETHGTGCP